MAKPVGTPTAWPQGWPPATKSQPVDCDLAAGGIWVFPSWQLPPLWPHSKCHCKLFDQIHSLLGLLVFNYTVYFYIYVSFRFVN
jgi:hypothetical protein